MKMNLFPNSSTLRTPNVNKVVNINWNISSTIPYTSTFSMLHKNGMHMSTWITLKWREIQESLSNVVISYVFVYKKLVMLTTSWVDYNNTLFIKLTTSQPKESFQCFLGVCLTLSTLDKSPKPSKLIITWPLDNKGKTTTNWTNLYFLSCGTFATMSLSKIKGQLVIV